MTKSEPKANLPKRGRPVDTGLKMRILDAAGALFISRGFYGTNMDEVARQAKVSKLSLYRRFPDKNALFRAVIERKCSEFLPPDLDQVFKGLSPKKKVREFAKAFLHLIMSDDAICIHRMMMAEAETQSDMIKMFYDAGPKPVKAIVDQMMIDFIKAKVIRGNNPQKLRNHLISIIHGSEMYLHRTLNIGKKPTHKEIDSHAAELADLFIRATMD